MTQYRPGSGVAVPLSTEDRTILDLESERIAGHTCKVVRLEGAISARSLAESIGSRLGEAPPLTRRLGGTTDSPAWVPDPDLDLEQHVVDGGRIPEGQVDRAVAATFAEHLPRNRPLWRMDVLGAEGGTMLVWRIHHALADGTAAMRFAEAVLWDAPGDRSGDPRKSVQSPKLESAGHRSRAGFVLREFGRTLRRNPFDAPAGRGRAVSFATVPLAPLHDAARELASATLNDAILVTIAGGTRRWLSRHHAAGRSLRIKVPVSLHGSGDEAGNRDSFFVVPVPLSEDDPATRLAQVREETAVRKVQHDAEEMDALLRHLAGASPRLRRLTERIERSGRAFAMNVSNVRGPDRPVAVLGVPAASVHSLAELAEHHVLRVAVVSVAGRLHFGLVADSEVVDDLPVLAAGIEAEAEAIVAAAGG